MKKHSHYKEQIKNIVFNIVIGVVFIAAVSQLARLVFAKSFIDGVFSLYVGILVFYSMYYFGKWTLQLIDLLSPVLQKIKNAWVALKTKYLNKKDMFRKTNDSSHTSDEENAYNPAHHADDNQPFDQYDKPHVWLALHEDTATAQEQVDYLRTLTPSDNPNRYVFYEDSIQGKQLKMTAQIETQSPSQKTNAPESIVYQIEINGKTAYAFSSIKLTYETYITSIRKLETPEA